MKLAVIADLHLGFAWGTERGEDSFRNAREAFQKALNEKPDVILLLGDIFHDKIPKPEVLAPAIEMFTKLNKAMKPVKILSRIKNKKEEIQAGTIPAIIGIYGTHERRSAYSVNPVQTLTSANLIYYLHAESIMLDLGGRKLGIHGLSGVPEAYARDAMTSWSPQPFPQAKNLLMIHQDFKELIPNPGALSFADLPNGFDAFLLGHIHWRVEDKHPAFNTPILIPGSTVRTQLRANEAKIRKGIYILEFGAEMHITFRELDGIRDFQFIKLDISKKKPSEIMTEIVEFLNKSLQYKTPGLKPMYRFKLKGELEGFLPTDLTFKSIIKRFEDNAIVKVDKSDVSSSKLSEKVKLLADLKSNKLSIDQLGLDLLIKNLKTDNRERAELIFNLLADGNLAAVEKEL